MGEGELDGCGFWAENEDDGAEGFLDAQEDVFYVYREQNESWFQRRFQGRRSRKGKMVEGRIQRPRQELWWKKILPITS